MEDSNRKLTYSEDVWDGFQGITNFYAKQKEWMKVIYNGWKSEGEYIMKIGKYYKTYFKEKKPNAEVYGVLFNAIDDALREYQHNVGEKIYAVGATVEKDLYTELHDIKMQISDFIKTNSTVEKRLEKDWKNAQTSVIAAQKTDSSQCQALIKLAEARRSTTELNSQPKKIEKLNKQLYAAKDNVLRARSEYERKVDYFQMTHKVYQDEMKSLLDSMQQFDEDRLERTKKTILKYAAKQVELAKEMLAQAENLYNNLNNLDPSASIQHWISQNRSKNVRQTPDAFQFQPYFSDVSKIDEIVEQAIQSNTAPSTSTATAPPKDCVQALYDYTAEGSEEVTIKVGDVLEVIERREDGWWYGVNTSTGMRGLFPANYVGDVSDNKPLTAEKDEQGRLVAPALYDYESTDPSELEFVEGDYLIILQTFDDGWCYAENKRTGLKGLAPQNYLQMS